MRAAAVTLTPPAKAASRNTRKDAVRNLPSNTGQATGALILLCYLFLKSNTISLKKILCGQAASERRGMYTAAPLQICHLVLLLSITNFMLPTSDYGMGRGNYGEALPGAGMGRPMPAPGRRVSGNRGMATAVASGPPEPASPRSGPRARPRPRRLPPCFRRSGRPCC